MKMPFTWWVGWFCLVPVRMFFWLVMGLVFVLCPSWWYGWLDCDTKDNPEHWEVK